MAKSSAENVSMSFRTVHHQRRTFNANQCHGRIQIAQKRQNGKRLRRGLAATIGDLDAGLEIAVHVHESPFVFPLFAGCVVADFPGFVKGFEPASSLVCIQVSPSMVFTYQK